MKRKIFMPMGLVLVLALFAISIFSSCSNTDNNNQTVITPQEYLDQSIAAVDKDRLAIDLAIIDDSISNAGLTEQVQKEPNGVRYVINSLGTGENVKLEDFIRMKYSGTLLSNGDEFDANDNLGFELYRLIIGFQTTIPLLPIGTEATLYIPSGYGYGISDIKNNSTGDVLIPANSNLVFHITLLGNN